MENYIAKYGNAEKLSAYRKGYQYSSNLNNPCERHKKFHRRIFVRKQFLRNQRQFRLDFFFRHYTIVRLHN